ncbi:MAG TPA: hypothetical protein VKX41_13100 [Alloacidobacterium sp.]|jgi:hypothetical protein|nr:hypothetical protein [Alloacidobacterium sp.]
MEQTPDGRISQADASTGTMPRKKAADYVYQVATVAAALLLLLTATV